jgi:hypothetical protein
MKRLEVSGAVRPIYGSLGVEWLTNLMHKIFFYNKFIISLYMFRALCARHQEVKIVRSQPVHGTATYRCGDIPDAV